MAVTFANPLADTSVVRHSSGIRRWHVVSNHGSSLIYIPCRHERLHNGGWMEEQYVLIGGRQERVAIAPCMLLSPEAGRVQSWLETLSLVLHRKIVHEFVLRQLLLQRYGEWFDFRNVGKLLRGLPVFYRSRSDRYYLLRDVVRLLPHLHRFSTKHCDATESRPAATPAAALSEHRLSDGRCDALPLVSAASSHA